MTCATDLCAKVVTTLGSGLRSRTVVTIAALLGVVGLVAWPLIALPAAWADSAPASAPGAGPAGISADIAPGAPTKPSISPSAPAEKTLKTGPSDQSAEDSQTPRTKVVADQVTLSIDALIPEVLHSDQDLVLSGTITNGTGQVVTGVDLVTRVQRSTEVTSLGLTKWLNGTDESGLSDPLTVPLGRDLQPGEVTQFSITVPADELPLTSADQWGPRGIAVKLESQGGSLAQDRSILVWDNGASVAPVRLTAFIPVTASAQETAVLAGPRNQERKEALTRIHSRVLGLLGMAGDGVVVAVDPALVEALGVTSASLEEAARNGGSRSSASEGAPQTPQGGDCRSVAEILGAALALGERDRDIAADQDPRRRHPTLRRPCAGHRHGQSRGPSVGRLRYRSTGPSAADESHRDRHAAHPGVGHRQGGGAGLTGLAGLQHHGLRHGRRAAAIDIHHHRLTDLFAGGR